MPALHVVKPFSKFPSVICPGCQVPMVIKDMKPIKFTTDSYSATYRCVMCETETKRQFKREKD